MIDKAVKKEKMIVLIASLGIFVSRCVLIYFMDGPFIYADEMGYWSHAANMAGLQWSIEGTSWYSFGYSFFLVPLFWISHNMSLLYRLALLLNAVMGVLSFLICYDIGKRLLPETDCLITAVLSFLVMMYPAFLAQSYIAWSETALYLFVWLLFWLLLRFEDKQDLSLSVLIGVVLGIIYMMHNRSVGILAAYCAVGFIAALLRRINWKYYAVSVIVLGLMLAGCTWVKNILLIKYVKNFESPSLSGNGISAIINKFRMLSPAELCRGLTASLSGQVWYLLAATGMLVLWGIILCLRHIKRKEKFLFYGTALAALAATMAVSGIWWMDLLHYAESLKVEGNGLFYGRYNECVLGIFLLLGMFYLMQNGMEKKNVILFLAGAGLMLVTGALLSVNVSSMDDFYLQSCNMFALEYYRWFGEFRVIVCTIVGLLAALALFAGIGAGKRNPQRKYRERVAVCFAFVLFWGLTALQGTRSFTMVEQRYTKQYNEMFDYLKALQADRFYVCGNYKIAADIQTRVVDSEVIRLYDVPEDMEENSYLLVEDEAAEDYDLSQFEDCYEFLDCTLYKK